MPSAAAQLAGDHPVLRGIELQQLAELARCGSPRDGGNRGRGRSRRDWTGSRRPPGAAARGSCLASVGALGECEPASLLRSLIRSASADLAGAQAAPPRRVPDARFEPRAETPEVELPQLQMLLASSLYRSLQPRCCPRNARPPRRTRRGRYRSVDRRQSHQERGRSRAGNSREFDPSCITIDSADCRRIWTSAANACTIVGRPRLLWHLGFDATLKRRTVTARSGRSDFSDRGRSEAHPGGRSVPRPGGLGPLSWNASNSDTSVRLNDDREVHR